VSKTPTKELGIVTEMIAVKGRVIIPIKIIKVWDKEIMRTTPNRNIAIGELTGVTD